MEEAEATLSNKVPLAELLFFPFRPMLLRSLGEQPVADGALCTGSEECIRKSSL